jgi:hypothetical protein
MSHKLGFCRCAKLLYLEEPRKGGIDLACTVHCCKLQVQEPPASYKYSLHDYANYRQYQHEYSLHRFTQDNRHQLQLLEQEKKKINEPINSKHDVDEQAYYVPYDVTPFTRYR